MKKVRWAKKNKERKKDIGREGKKQKEKRYKRIKELRRSD